MRRTVARPVHQMLQHPAALTEVEVRSALRRLVREGRVGHRPGPAPHAAGDPALHPAVSGVRITRTIVTQAGLASSNAILLWGYDAVQLACALAVQRLLHQRGNAATPVCHRR